MAFFPHDPTKYRPAKFILRADLLKEADRAIQEGLGGYENRHELVNDAIEQLLVELRYGDEDGPVATRATSQAEERARTTARKTDRDGKGAARGAEAAAVVTTDAAGAALADELGLDDVPAIIDLTETAITAPAARGVAVVNELAAVRELPQLGLHNRDAPSVFALASLGRQAHEEPIPMRAFYEKATNEAWRLAAALAPWETEHRDKVTVMLPRNRAKPQTAAEGFQLFGIGQVNRRPDEHGRVAALGPFYLWGVAGLLPGPSGEILIGVTDAGWELLEAMDGLHFGLPHDPGVAHRFLAHLRRHAPADLWGFKEVLAAIAGEAGRNELREHFRHRLAADFPPDKAVTESVAESTAQGYLSRARAWGLVTPKLVGGRYELTEQGESVMDDLNDGDKRAPIAAAA